MIDHLNTRYPRVRVAMTKTIRVPDAPAPKGLCWAQDTRLDGSSNTVMARCNYPKNHEGPHQWTLSDGTPQVATRTRLMKGRL